MINPPARTPVSGWATLLVAALLALPLAASGRGKPGAAAKSSSAASSLVTYRDLRGHRIRRGANLRGANLRFADLRHCDLRETDLRGADLTGALLQGADCTGAKMDGARLFKADATDALGLDLTGAITHPFFDAEPGEPVGTVKFLDFREESGLEPGVPHGLASAPDGRIFWLENQGPVIRTVTRTGLRGTIMESGDTRLYALVRDARDRIWSLGDRMFGLFDFPAYASLPPGSPLVFDHHLTGLDGRPNHVTPGADGSVWVSMEGKAWCLSTRPKPGGVRFNIEQMVFQDPRIPRNARVVSSRDGHKVFFVAPEQANIFVYHRDLDRMGQLTNEAGARPFFPVMGPDNRVWTLLDGVNRILEADLDQAVSEAHPLEAEGPVRARGLAAGPDGAMWFTDMLGCRIGRIRPGGPATYFPLPADVHPMEIALGSDGRMLFTVAGKPMLGAIRAVAAPDRPDRAVAAPDRPDRAEAEGEAAARASREASWQVPLYRPRPEALKGLSRAQRHALADRRQAAAEARMAERLAVEPEAPAPPDTWFAADAGAEPEPLPEPVAQAALAVATPAVAAAAADAATTPEDILLDLGINLSDSGLRHILRNHGQTSPRHKSRFAPAYQSRAGLEVLLAENLPNAGKLGHFQVVDGLGRFVTYCRAKTAVGWKNTRGRLKATCAFLLVTDAWVDQGEPVHDVVTAYPVAER